MINKLIFHRLFVSTVRSKYCFTSEAASCSFCPIDPLFNNWFKVQPINRIPLGPMREPFIQDSNSVLKGKTYLLTLKQVGGNSILHPTSVAIHPLLPRSGRLIGSALLSCPHLCGFKNNNFM